MTKECDKENAISIIQMQSNGNDENSRDVFTSVFCCGNILDSAVDETGVGKEETKRRNDEEVKDMNREAIERSYEVMLSINPDESIGQQQVHPLQIDGDEKKTLTPKNLNENELFDATRLKENLSMLSLNPEDDDFEVESVLSTVSDINVMTRRRGIESLPKFRTSRLRQLRKRMTLDPSGSIDYRDSLMKNTHSFDTHLNDKKTAANPEKIQRFLSESRNPLNTPKDGVEDQLSSFFTNNLACDCGTVDPNVNERDSLVERNKSLFEFDDEIAYDSDPEFFHSNSAMEPVKHPEYESPEKNTSNKKKKKKKKHALDERRDRHLDKMVLNNEELAANVIKKLKHDNINLIWHLPKEDNSHPPPTCIKAWIELGCRLRTQIIQPKLIWRSAYSEGMKQKKGRNLLSEPECSGEVDLLDISRIISPPTIDREQYPFAMTNKSFLIITSDKRRFLFETSTLAERQRLVAGMKILVANLASMIIVGDKTIFEDFFHPIAFGEYQKQNEVVTAITTA